MRLLDRYLLRELLVPLGFILGGILIFLISADLIAELENFQKRKLGGVEVLEYYAIVTPGMMVIVLPVSLLLALLYALTNHGRHNEVTAIRAAGVSLWRLCAPYLAVGLLASLVLLVVNEFWVPKADYAAERVLDRHLGRQTGEDRTRARNIGFTNSRDQRTWQIGEFNLKTAEMTNPKVDWHLPDGSHRELIAKSATWTGGYWTFHDVWQNTYAADGAITNRDHFASLPLPAFTETPDQIRSEIKISERLSQRKAKRADLPLAEIIDYLRLHPDSSGLDRSWIYTKLHGRLAAPWTCLVVVLIAIPFGAASARRNVFVGVAASVVICFAYFVLLQLGLALGAGGFVPPWLGAWLPNATFGAAGIWMTLRVR